MVTTSPTRRQTILAIVVSVIFGLTTGYFLATFAPNPLLPTNNDHRMPTYATTDLAITPVQAPITTLPTIEGTVKVQPVANVHQDLDTLGVNETRLLNGTTAYACMGRLASVFVPLTSSATYGGVQFSFVDERQTTDNPDPSALDNQTSATVFVSGNIADRVQMANSAFSVIVYMSTDKAKGETTDYQVVKLTPAMLVTGFEMETSVFLGASDTIIDGYISGVSVCTTVA